MPPGAVAASAGWSATASSVTTRGLGRLSVARAARSTMTAARARLVRSPRWNPDVPQIRATKTATAKAPPIWRLVSKTPLATL